METKRVSPYLKVIFAALLWSTSGIFIRLLSFSPGVFSFFRMAIPAVFLFIFLKIQKRILNKGSILLLLFGSFLNALRMFLYFFAYTYTSIGNAVVILYTWPVFMTILSIIFLREKIILRNMVLLFTAFAGIIIVFINKKFSFRDSDFIGMTAMLFSSIIYSFSLLIFKKNTKEYSGLEITFYQNIVGAIICIPFIFILPEITIYQITLISFMGLLVGVFAFFLFFSALRVLSSAKASLLSYLEVLSAICISVFIFHEPFTWNLLLGGSLILISVIILKR